MGIPIFEQSLFLALYQQRWLRCSTGSSAAVQGFGGLPWPDGPVPGQVAARFIHWGLMMFMNPGIEQAGGLWCLWCFWCLWCLWCLWYQIYDIYLPLHFLRRTWRQVVEQSNKLPLILRAVTPWMLQHNGWDQNDMSYASSRLMSSSSCTTSTAWPCKVVATKIEHPKTQPWHQNSNSAMDQPLPPQSPSSPAEAISARKQLPKTYKNGITMHHCRLCRLLAPS